MNRLFGGVLLAGSAAVLMVFSPSVSAQEDRRFDPLRGLKPCTGGPNRGAPQPPAGPDDPTVQRCISRPTAIMAHPGGVRRRAPQHDGSDLPVPSAGYHFNGISTSTQAYNGISAGLGVEDITMPLGPYNFVASWIMARPLGSGTTWIQAGWSENAWVGDVRQVFHYDSIDAQWRFYGQYPLTDGGPFYHFTITQTQANVWATWLWWNNSWNLLRAAALPMTLAQVDLYVESYVTPGYEGYGHPTFPGLDFFNPFLFDASWNVVNWTPSVPTIGPSSASPYCTTFYTAYSSGAVYSVC